MSTKQQLQDDLKDAMRSGDKLRKTTLRMALAAIKLAEVDNRGELDESAVLAILQKEVKARKEAISDAQRAGRPEIVAEAESEIEILKIYLPEQLTPEELIALAQDVIAEVGATSPREMGQVMKALMPRLQGRATGSEASKVVRELLQ